VQALFPGTQITFGPATDDGFYYDFAPKARPFTDEDLPAIEAEMRKIIAANKPLRREVWSRETDQPLEAAGRKLQGRMGRRTARG
jgi:threonyl-tRNA synthetase